MKELIIGGSIAALIALLISVYSLMKMASWSDDRLEDLEQEQLNELPHGRESA